MSALLMGRVFYTELPAHLRLTLLALADFADDDGGSLFVGQNHLAMRIGASPRTVRANLGTLVDMGFLIPIDRVGSHGVNRYEMDLTQLPDDAAIGERKRVMRRPEDIAGRKSVDRKPTSTSTGSPLPTVDRKPTSYEPSELQPSEEPSEKLLAPPASTPLSDGIFDALYEIWLGRPYPGRADSQLTDRAADKLGMATAALRKAGATSDLVRQMPAAWIHVFPGARPPTWTPNAAIEHWPALVAWIERGYVPRGSADESADRLARLEASEAETLAGMARKLETG